MTDLIKPDEESSVRLFVFGAALLAITARERTQNPILDHPSLAPAWENEARTIADAVVAEAKRLSEGTAPQCRECLATADATGKIYHKHGCPTYYIRG